jgi:hypothetical protein
MRYTRGLGARIDGTVGELESLRQVVLALADDGTGSRTVTGEAGVDPAPYESVMTAVALTVGSGAALVEVTDAAGLKITASADNLRRFASCLDVPEDPPQGWHAHYKYFAGTEYILPSSVPVLVALRRPISD